MHQKICRKNQSNLLFCVLCATQWKIQTTGPSPFCFLGAAKKKSVRRPGSGYIPEKLPPKPRRPLMSKGNPSVSLGYPPKHCQIKDPRKRAWPFCGWTKSISHHFETMVETLPCWYSQGNGIILGLQRWCEIDFIHPQFLCCCLLRRGLPAPPRRRLCQAPEERRVGGRPEAPRGPRGFGQGRGAEAWRRWNPPG